MKSKFIKTTQCILATVVVACTSPTLESDAAMPESNTKTSVSTQKMAGYNLVVDINGTGDYKTIQQAFTAVTANNTAETKIFIKNGRYKEKLVLPKDKINVTIVGESKDNVIITYNDYASKLNSAGTAIGTSGSASFVIAGNNFKASSVTFENSSGNVGQAVAVRVDGDKAIFNNCNFLGFQDTLYTRTDTSRQYYYKCYIAGATDFIFGASTAVFDQCQIFAKKGGTYITAASTSQTSKFGYVFLNCNLRTDSAKSTYYLGRPWGNYAKTVFINCDMANHIKPEGWHNWSKPEAESTTFYGEYKSTGLGGNMDSRVKWSHKLTDAQVKEYTVSKIFNGWVPVL